MEGGKKSLIYRIAGNVCAKIFTFFLLFSVVRILILRMTYPLHKVFLHNRAELGIRTEHIYMSVCMSTYVKLTA